MSQHTLIKQFDLLVLVTVTVLLIAYFYTAVAEIIVLPKQQPLNRKNIIHICVAVLAAIYSFWAIFGSTKEIIYYLMAFILSSLPLYALLKWKGGKSCPFSSTHPQPLNAQAKAAATG